MGQQIIQVNTFDPVATLVWSGSCILILHQLNIFTSVKSHFKPGVRQPPPDFFEITLVWKSVCVYVHFKAMKIYSHVMKPE